jgi:hypothetical protein
MMLAPPGRAPWDILLDQLRYLETPPERVAEVEAAVERLKSGQGGEILGVPNKYWLDLASRNGIVAAKTLGKPCLILRGERDYQVTDADLEIWRTGLQGVSNVEIFTVPGVNHLFMKGGTGRPDPSEYMRAGQVEPVVLGKLVAFVKKHHR